MTSLDRAARLFQEFLSPRRVTYEHLTSRYGITRRTAHRWIRELDSVLNLRKARNSEGRLEFWIDRSDRFFRRFVRRPPNVEELAAVRSAITLLKDQQRTGDAERLERIYDLAREALEERGAQRNDANLRGRLMNDAEALALSLGIGARPTPRVRIDLDIDRNLRAALLHQHRVRFLYQRPGHEPKEHTASPVGILYGGAPRLVAEVEGRDDFLQFRLDRIRTLEVLSDEPHSLGEDDFSRYLARLFGTFQEAPVDVEWRFHPSAPGADKWIFHASQELTREEDGSVVVRFTAGGIDDMARHVIGWWDWIEVVKPVELRERVLRMKLAGLAPLLRQFAPDDPDLAHRVAGLAVSLGANLAVEPGTGNGST